MKKWSEMSHGEKAEFWGDVAAISGLLSLLSFVVLLAFIIYSIIAG